MPSIATRVASWFKRDLGDTSTQLIPPRSRSYGTVTVSSDTALRNSAVWACLRLRADLLSTMPLNAYRELPDGTRIAQRPTPFLLNPGGDRYGRTDWLYSSQVDLDRCGNVFGIIRAFDGLGKPAVVELVPISAVSVKGIGSTITEFRIHGKKYAPEEVWHERQFTVPGVPLGLSPIAYGAMTIGTALSAQQFAADWFANGSIPSGRLRNTARTINPTEAAIAKDRFRAAVSSRDLFVHGSDWEYDMLQVAANESQFLETTNASVFDIARFLGVPADLLDAQVSSGTKITYANITQRHLQVLVLNLGPTMVRREAALSSTLPSPRFVEFDASSLLRMDPASLASMLGGMISARMLAPSEAREMWGHLPPLTAAQLEEFTNLPSGNAMSAPSTAPTTPPEG